jgi:hypothetical protein
MPGDRQGLLRDRHHGQRQRNRRNSAGSISSFLAFSRKCADLGFTDLTVHYPRTDGIFSGDREKFRHIMAEALPIVREL